MQIYDLKEKQEYLEEVAILEYEMWANNKEENKKERIENKIEKIKQKLDSDNFCKLVLLDDDVLIGFISIFESDSKKYLELFPWYATMYVKEEFRGNGYSKILNDAILNKAKQMGYKKIYLKTTLSNYYEKFGAKVLIDDLDEKIMFFDL